MNLNPLSFEGGLDPLSPLCYICKVLVGPGTPYLGPDSKTRRSIARIAAPKAIMRGYRRRRRLEHTRGAASSTFIG